MLGVLFPGPASQGASCLCIILVRGLGVRGEGQVDKSESVQADLVNGNGKVSGWPEVWIMSELEVFSFAGLHKQRSRIKCPLAA